MFFGQMNENPVQRSLIGLSAITLAEHFRDDQKRMYAAIRRQHVPLYSECKNEVSTIIESDWQGGYEANGV